MQLTQEEFDMKIQAETEQLERLRQLVVGSVEPKNSQEAYEAGLIYIPNPHIDQS